ncbi:MAG: M28 family peptidase, partial [Acidobacteria bacterium]|nr:M28 family peptidase [Acidobacteriota bacterium]
MRSRHFVLPALLVTLVTAAPIAQQVPVSTGAAAIREADLREWLTYIASDELQGRATYTEGLGLAAGYISSHLQQWGVKPAGDHGTYLQVVRVLGIRNNSKATVTVNVNGQSRTFKDGEGVSFSKNMGGRQTITGEQIEFVGHGLQVPSSNHDDYAGVDAKGKVLVYLSVSSPSSANTMTSGRGARALSKGAIAVVGPQPPTTPGRASTPTVSPSAAPGGGRGPSAPDNGDFTTVRRYDLPVAPQVTAADEFFEFLFSGSNVKYAELKMIAEKREALPRFPLKGVKMTIDIEPDYQVVRTRITNNVVGIVEGSDPKLRDTYVAFGAHYDHVGYREAGAPAGGDSNPGGCAGQVRETPRPGDNLNNGADDDGSGTVALMALARAFAQEPKPKRSLLFVWHAGEEQGLLGSVYMAEHPVVGSNEKIVAQLNMDMIGRTRCDDPAASNMVLVVGSDRISTELHNLNEDANTSMDKPLTLNYEMNDPADPQSIYTRSDHYSYASKGIPIIFYFTGLHKDYHFVTDEISKIEFPKLARVAQLVYA